MWTFFFGVLTLSSLICLIGCIRLIVCTYSVYQKNILTSGNIVDQYGNIIGENTIEGKIISWGTIFASFIVLIWCSGMIIIVNYC